MWVVWSPGGSVSRKPFPTGIYYLGSLSILSRSDFYLAWLAEDVKTILLGPWNLDLEPWTLNLEKDSWNWRRFLKYICYRRRRFLGYILSHRGILKHNRDHRIRKDLRYRMNRNPLVIRGVFWSQKCIKDGLNFAFWKVFRRCWIVNHLTKFFCYGFPLVLGDPI